MGLNNIFKDYLAQDKKDQRKLGLTNTVESVFLLGSILIQILHLKYPVALMWFPQCNIWLLSVKHLYA